MAMLFVTSEPAAAAPIALTAGQFAADPSLYQAVAAQAAAIRERIVSNRAACGGSYAATEAANAIAAG
jgi:PE family